MTERAAMTERAGMTERPGMPEQRAAMEDFRSDDERRADRKLAGTWWRCPQHGITDEPILLSSVAYCPKDECASPVKLVHSAINDPNANAQARSVWRKSSDLFLPPAAEAD